MGPLLKRYSCGSMLDKSSSADLEGVRTILPLDTLGRSHDAQNNHLSAHFARTRYRSSTAADFNRRSARTVEDSTTRHSFLYSRAAQWSRATGRGLLEAGPTEGRPADCRDGNCSAGDVADERYAFASNRCRGIGPEGSKCGTSGASAGALQHSWPGLR